MTTPQRTGGTCGECGERAPWHTTDCSALATPLVVAAPPTAAPGVVVPGPVPHHEFCYLYDGHHACALRRIAWLETLAGAPATGGSADWPAYPAPLPVLPDVDRENPHYHALSAIGTTYDRMREHAAAAEPTWEQEATAVRREAKALHASFFTLAALGHRPTTTPSSSPASPCITSRPCHTPVPR